MNLQVTLKTQNLINGITNRNKKEKYIDKFDHNNKLLEDPTETANEFCKYFTEIGPKYAEQIKMGINDYHYYLNKSNRNINSMFLTPTDENEIKKVIKDCRPKISSGHDK